PRSDGASTCGQVGCNRAATAARGRPRSYGDERAITLPRWHEIAACVASLRVDLLGEVVLLADLPDQLELGLDPVGVLLLGDQDPREQILGGAVAAGARRLDALVEELDRDALELE